MLNLQLKERLESVVQVHPIKLNFPAGLDGDSGGSVVQGEPWMDG